MAASGDDCLWSETIIKAQELCIDRMIAAGKGTATAKRNLALNMELEEISKRLNLIRD
jgi:hypothetical protein